MFIVAKPGGDSDTKAAVASVVPKVPKEEKEPVKVKKENGALLPEIEKPKPKEEENYKGGIVQH